MIQLNRAPASPPPRSAEIERILVANCFAEDGVVLKQCATMGLTPAALTDPALRLVFETQVELWKRKLSPSRVAVLAELSVRDHPDAVAGYSGLKAIEGPILPVGEASHLIRTMLAAQERRNCSKLLHQASAQINGLRVNEELGKLTATLSRELARYSHASENLEVKDHPTISDLLAFETSSDPDCLLGERYLGRTNAMILAGPSGAGKSTLALQLAMLAALGRDLFGLKSKHPLRVLYVQAEDDFGDVAQVVKGVVKHYSLDEEAVRLLDENLRIERWTDVTGERFINRLATTAEGFPFDLVFINPMFSFAGCDLMSSSETSHFLRELLNPLLHQTNSAAVVVHHTKKPPTDPKNERHEDQSAYDSFGSSEITNWARATISLQPVRGTASKVCKLIFGKRGPRAGLVNEAGNPITSILIEHSPSGICWRPSDWAPPSTASGQFQIKFDLHRAREVYNPSLTWAQNKRAIAAAQGVTARTVANWRKEVEKGPGSN